VLKNIRGLLEKSVSPSVMILFSALFLLTSPTLVNAWEVHNKAFSDPNNVETDAVEVVGDKIYWGTSNIVSGAKLWSYDGSSYQLISADGFGEVGNRIITDIVGFNGNIIVATYNALGTEIWEFDGTALSQINTNGFGDPSSYFTDVLIVFEGDLYAATYNGSLGGAVWRYDGGSSWTQVSISGFGGNNTIWAGEIFQGNMYIGTSKSSGGELWRYDGGSSWTQIASGGIDDTNNRALRGLYSYGDFLYVTTENSITGTEVWTYDGSVLNQINLDGFGNPNNRNIEEKGIVSFQEEIYFGVSNSTTGAELWKLSNGVFSNVNIGDTHNIDNGTLSAAAEYDNCIYFGSGNLVDGSEVIRSCVPTAIADMVSITNTTNQIDIDVLSNDIYDNLDPSTIEIITEPLHGRAIINPDNTIRYELIGDYSGVDTFEYQICTFDGFCSVTLVTIDISSTQALAASGQNISISSIVGVFFLVLVSSILISKRGLFLQFGKE
jgi:hypothetical protein